ncbi:MAG: fibrobacter succinogenes major paralogous domain-containing protein [Chitinispirillales bacterium]|jgi:uncharacterized protein (TIGR02145 family)|nr:fibrobacter succinogenes major paralogous domain-containing protein [Chitinispirillales bacterium]
MRLRSWLAHGRAVLLASAAVVAVVGTGWLMACGGGGGGKESSSEKKSEQGSVSGKSGKFTDTRDGQKYRIVKIGNHVWMAENLRYKIGDSWCYGNDDSKCSQYGRLYDWNMAKRACPSGWHLPSKDEWEDLVVEVGSTGGKKLKASSGWNERWNENGNGTDEYGFSALPGGHRYTDGGFYNAGTYSYWWSATELAASYAYGRNMYYDYDNVGEFYNGKEYGFSVRCVGD